MDPEATLTIAAQQLKTSGDREECAYTLGCYFSWRIKGGFEPTDGDARALRLLLNLGAVADTLTESLNHPTGEKR